MAKNRSTVGRVA